MSELNYKRIVDVDYTNTLQANASVFINDGGTLKQIAANDAFATKAEIETQEDRIKVLEEKPIPPATADTLGGVKVGEGLTVDESGTLGIKPKGELEDIEVITFSSTGYTTITRDVTPEGDAYEYDALYLSFVITIGETVPNLVQSAIRTTNNSITFSWTKQFAANSTLYATIRCAKNNGIWDAASIGLSSSNSFSMSESKYGPVVKATAEDFIDKVTMNVLGDATMEVKIQGVRHNA